LGEKGIHDPDGYLPNSKAVTITMNQDEFELLKMAMSRGAGFKGQQPTLTAQRNSGKGQRVYTMNKKGVEVVSKNRMELNMGLAGEVVQQAARNSKNNAVLQAQEILPDTVDALISIGGGFFERERKLNGQSLPTDTVKIDNN